MQSTLIQQFGSDKQLVRTLFNNFGKVIVFIFYAEWNEQSKNLLKNFAQSIQMFGDFPNAKYFSLSAQKCPQIFKKYEVQYTPTIIFTKTDKKILKKFESKKQSAITDIGSIIDQLEKIHEEQRIQFLKQQPIWHARIEAILKSCPIIVFIKGTPQNPKCGFTTQMLDILKKYQLNYNYYDIIEDQYMRYWLREYKGWPTYPQIYIQGQLIGGLDKVREMVQKQQFQKLLPKSSKKQDNQNKYDLLLKQNNRIVFIDGFPFLNKQSQKIIDQAKQKDQNFTIINVEFDNQFKAFLTKKKLLPFIVENGNIL